MGNVRKVVLGALVAGLASGAALSPAAATTKVGPSDYRYITASSVMEPRQTGAGYGTGVGLSVALQEDLVSQVGLDRANRSSTTSLPTGFLTRSTCRD